MEVSAWLKAWNMRSFCSGVMPMPVSRTRKCSVTPASSSASADTSTTTSPATGNLTALLPRFTSTCPRRSGSQTSAVGRVAGASNSSSSPLDSAFRPTMLAVSSSTSSSRNGTCSRAIFPASIFEKSRMSLMMPSRLSAARFTFSM